MLKVKLLEVTNFRTMLSSVNKFNFFENLPIINKIPHCCYSSFNMFNKPKTLNLLPADSLVVPNCGMKTRGHLQLRCKDCYMARKDGQLYVLCSSYPRHKQQALRKREKYQWILTYAFQSKRRPY